MIEAIKQLQKEVVSITDKIDDIAKNVNAINVDRQMYVHGNTKISPSIGCKFKYDENGLILGKEDLIQSDIPQLDIDKIEGLRTILADKASRKDLINISVDYDEIFKRREVKHTACKVNYDKYGVIQSSSELVVQDIPHLPMDHIDGLNDKITELIEMIPIETNEELPTISAGTACKITFDKHGRITNGTDLSMTDIPSEIISRLNVLESRLTEMTTTKTLDAMYTTLNNKVDKASNVKAGTYQKVVVNENGLVTSGDMLKLSDLPQINITDIYDLNNVLSGKAEHKDVVDLTMSVSKITTLLTKIGDITKLKEGILRNVDDKLTQLISRIDDLESSVHKLQTDTLLINKINELENTINELNNLDYSILSNEEILRTLKKC